MIQFNLVYDEVKDISPVDQFGFVDLVKSFQNGYVPGSSSDVVERYNDIEEPGSIIGRPKDAFEAMRMQDTIVANAKERGKAVSSSASKDENE